MKKIFYYILIISCFSFAQNNNCCDSIKKANKKSVYKTGIKKTIDNKPYEIIVTVDNSNSANNYSNQKSCEKKSNDKIEDSKFDWKELYKNLITIALGLIAAFIALYQMKSNIISSARIRWIEDLKDCLSKFYTASLDVQISYENHLHSIKIKDNNHDKYYDTYDSHMTQFNILMNRIKMQLNSNESNHKQIEDIMDKIDSKLSNMNNVSVTQQEIEADLKQIVQISKGIFKNEWEKSKKLFKI